MTTKNDYICIIKKISKGPLASLVEKLQEYEMELMRL